MFISPKIEAYFKATFEQLFCCIFLGKISYLKLNYRKKSKIKCGFRMSFCNVYSKIIVYFKAYHCFLAYFQANFVLKNNYKLSSEKKLIFFSIKSGTQIQKYHVRYLLIFVAYFMAKRFSVYTFFEASKGPSIKNRG